MINQPQPKTPQIFVTLQPNPVCVNVYETQTILVQVLARVLLMASGGSPEVWRIDPAQQEEEISFVMLPLPGECIAPEDAWHLVSLLRQQPEIMDAILILRTGGN